LIGKKVIAVFTDRCLLKKTQLLSCQSNISECAVKKISP